MAKDPAFLFYSQDFYTGVATLDWEERGKFISILCLMHQKGRMDEKTISFLVGSISVNLKSKFSIDEKGLWYNKRLEEETAKRNKFTESRRDNGSLGGRPKKEKPTTQPKQKLVVKHMDNHMGNENEDVIENEILLKYKEWTQQVLEETDAQFQEMLYNEKTLKLTGLVFDTLAKDHLGLLNRYPNMRPRTQQSFRESLMKHIRENYNKANGNTTGNIQKNSTGGKTFSGKYEKTL